MNYIKIFNVTPQKPEIIAMARRLHKSQNEVLGACVRLWCWVDEHSEDGIHTGLTARELDDIMGTRGMCKQLVRESWLAEVEGAQDLLVVGRTFYGQTSKWRARRAKMAAREAKAKAANERARSLSASTEALAREIVDNPEAVQACEEMMKGGA